MSSIDPAPAPCFKLGPCQRSKGWARAILSAGCLALVWGCSPAPTPQVSAEGLKTCRERQIEESANANQETLRAAYRSCLKTIDADLKKQAQTDRSQRQQEAQQVQLAAQQQGEGWASASARYTHCRMVQGQVADAEQRRLSALSLALLAARKFGTDSAQAQTANASLNDAIANLERLIPEPMRAGKPLIPDSVKIYQHCDPSQFSD